MSHHLESDVRYMRALADAQGPHYIGLLGPTARRNRVVHALGAEVNGRVKHGIEQAYRECAHANTRRGTEKQAFGGLDAQTAVKRRDGGGSTCQVMDQKIVLAAARRSGVS